MCLSPIYPDVVQGEHTAEHRFRVYGKVYDNSGNPLSGNVYIKDAADRILGMTEASGSGYYTIRLHLHNSNLGDKLFVQSKGGTQELIVRFDPDDKTTPRMAEVNFGVVPPSTGWSSNRPLLVGIATLAVASTFYFVMKKRKQQKKRHDKKKRRGPAKKRFP